MLLSFFFSLVYNEIIIIKLWTLYKNTSKCIKEREKTEYDILGQNSNENEDDDFNSRGVSLTFKINMRYKKI